MELGQSANNLIHYIFRLLYNLKAISGEVEYITFISKNEYSI